MAGLVERIEVQAPPGRLDGTRQITTRLTGRGQPIEQAQHGPLNGCCPGRPPVVELDAVAEREPGQERSAHELGGAGQVGDAA